MSEKPKQGSEELLLAAEIAVRKAVAALMTAAQQLLESGVSR